MSPANMSGMDRLVERFLSYIAIDTSSDPASDRIPSTAGQLTLEKNFWKSSPGWASGHRWIKTALCTVICLPTAGKAVSRPLDLLPTWIRLLA